MLNLDWSFLGNSNSSLWLWITKKHAHLLTSNVWSQTFLSLSLELLDIKDRASFSNVVKPDATIAFRDLKTRRAIQHALLELFQRNQCTALSGLNICLLCCSADSLKKMMILICSLTLRNRYLKGINPIMREELSYSSQYLKRMFCDRRKVKRILNSSTYSFSKEKSC